MLGYPPPGQSPSRDWSIVTGAATVVVILIVMPTAAHNLTHKTLFGRGCGINTD